MGDTAQEAGPGEVILSKRHELGLLSNHHQEPNAPAAWRYYEILTAIRAELRKQL